MLENRFRYDFFSIENLKSGKLTDQGFLKAPMFATRVGVFKYIMPDGSIRRELRRPSEVFNKDSLSTLANIPITIKHPKEMVNSKTATKLTVGTTGEMPKVVDNKYIEVNSTIFDEKSIRRVLAAFNGEDGLGEVSAGYHADIDETPGTFQGEEYDVEQKNIRYNHVALVDRGRMGSQVKIRLDSESAIIYDEEMKQLINDELNENNIGDTNMEKIKIGDSTFEVKPELKKAFDTMMKGHKDSIAEMMKKNEGKKDAVDEVVSDIKAQRDKAEAKADSLETKVTDLETKLTEAVAKTDSAAISKLILERKNVEAVAEKVFSTEIEKGEVKLDSFESTLDIKKAVVKKISPDLAEEKLDSDVYVDARFDAISEKPVAHNDALAADIEKKEVEKKEAKNDTKEVTPEWQQPLTTTK